MFHNLIKYVFLFGIATFKTETFKPKLQISKPILAKVCGEVNDLTNYGFIISKAKIYPINCPELSRKYYLNYVYGSLKKESKYSKKDILEAGYFSGKMILFPTISPWKFIKGKVIYLHPIKHTQSKPILETFRRRIRNYICNRSLKNTDLILSLIIGDQSQVSNLNYQIFRNSGTSHLIAISGLHIGILSVLIQRVFSLLHIISSNTHIEIIIRAFIAFFCIIFLIISGNSISSQRSFIMSMYNSGGTFFSGSSHSLWPLVFSSLVILLINPMALFSTSFQLSFSAVYGLLATPKNKVLKSIGLNMMLFPIIFYKYGNFNLLSPLVNIIVIPIFSICIMPILLLSLLVSPLLVLTDIFLSYLMLFLKLAEKYGIYLNCNISLTTCIIWLVINFFLILLLSSFYKNKITITKKDFPSGDIL